MGSHHNARHDQQARQLKAIAAGNPAAICWRCGRTLDQHPPHRNGDPQTWDAGHTVDGATNPPVWPHVDRRPPPGVPYLALEASRCNRAAGAAAGNRRRGSGYDWP